MDRIYVGLIVLKWLQADVIARMICQLHREATTDAQTEPPSFFSPIVVLRGVEADWNASERTRRYRNAPEFVHSPMPLLERAVFNTPRESAHPKTPKKSQGSQVEREREQEKKTFIGSSPLSHVGDGIRKSNQHKGRKECEKTSSK